MRNCEAIRPDIAGIMGAFGAALIARERYSEGNETTMLSISKDQMNSLKINYNPWPAAAAVQITAVLQSTNLTVDVRFVSGNRCERANR